MAGLEGTVKTPVGPMKKQTALYVGAAAVVLGGIVYYRHKQAAANTSQVSTSAEIDPATGYAYGSPDDLAALQQQANTPVVTGGGTGGSSIPTQGTGFVNNASWSQAVMTTLSSTIQDESGLSAALGKYLTGSYVADGSADESLIQQAIAAEGYPPVSGPNGYPPSINRNPPNSTGGTGSTGGTTNSDPTLPGPTGLHAVRIDEFGVSLDWNEVPGAIGYKILVNGKQSGNSVVYSNAYVDLPKRKTHYAISVLPINVKNRVGHTTGIDITTK